MTMVSYVPKLNKAVVLLSSMHHKAHIDPASTDKQKPGIITYYNSTKGGVDTNDHLCGTYNVGRRTKQWPLAIFFHLINVSAINALIVHRANTDKLRTHVRRNFLWQLSVELIRDHQKRRWKCMSWKIASHPLQNWDVAIAPRRNAIVKYQQNARNVQDLCAMITLKYTVNSVTRVIQIIPKDSSINYDLSIPKYKLLIIDNYFNLTCFCIIS